MTGRYLPFLSFAIILALASGQGCPADMGSEDNTQYTTNDQTDNGDNHGADDGTNDAGSDNPDDTDPGDDAPSGSTVQVEIDEYAFEPKTITIQVGQTVKWTNREFTPHRVRSGDPEDADKGDLFRSFSLGMSKSFEYTFDTPGTYEYHDEYHYSRDAMRDAKVIVTE